MRPMEAYHVIFRCISELHAMRKAIYPMGKAYCQDEIEAQVIAFEALRRMEESEDDMK